MEIKVRKLSYKELEQGYKNALNKLSKCEKKLDKIKEYAQELRFFDNESVEFEISNKILDYLEVNNE